MMSYNEIATDVHCTGYIFKINQSNFERFTMNQFMLDGLKAIIKMLVFARSDLLVRQLDSHQVL